MVEQASTVIGADVRRVRHHHPSQPAAPRRREDCGICSVLSVCDEVEQSERPLALYEITDRGMQARAPVGFAALALHEPRDLQRLLREDISVLDADLLVVAEEFSRWQDARRRIDLLALDKNGHLVVIELKRTDDAGHADLQALRYAAMVSPMTFEQVVDAYADHLQLQRPDDDLDARAELLTFLDADADTDPDELITSDVRIVLVAAGFDREITTTVLWLNGCEGIDIRCVRLIPYELAGKVLLDVQQVIPLPEAADYQVQLRRKEAERKRAQRTHGRDLTRYHIVVDGTTLPDENKRNAVRVMVEQLVARGADLPTIRSVLRPTKMKAVQGEYHDTDELAEALLAAYPKVRVARHFIEQPFHQDGTTYVLSKMWGTQTERVLTELRGAFPEAAVDFRTAD